MLPEASFGSEKLHCDLASNKKSKKTLNVTAMMSLATKNLKTKKHEGLYYVIDRYTECMQPYTKIVLPKNHVSA